MRTKILKEKIEETKKEIHKNLFLKKSLEKFYFEFKKENDVFLNIGQEENEIIKITKNFEEKISNAKIDLRSLENFLEKLEYKLSILEMKSETTQKKRSKTLKLKKFVAQKFYGKFRTTGEPYAEHVFRVADRLKKHDEKILGLMHDLFEDTNATRAELLEIGVSEWLIDIAENVLTKREGEEYETYILRCRKNKIARAVKFADIQDNLATLHCFLPKIKKRKAEKYQNAISLLFEKY